MLFIQIPFKSSIAIKQRFFVEQGFDKAILLSHWSLEVSYIVYVESTQHCRGSDYDLSKDIYSFKGVQLNILAVKKYEIKLQF